MGKDAVAIVEDERNDAGLGAHRCDVQRQIGDGHGLREQARELPVNVNRGIEEQDRGAEQGRPERGLPPRAGQGCAGCKPFHGLRPVGPVLHQRPRGGSLPSPSQRLRVGDADSRHLRCRAQRAQNELDLFHSRLVFDYQLSWVDLETASGTLNLLLPADGAQTAPQFGRMVE